MKKIHLTLLETTLQAKLGSRNARRESLLDRLPANRSVKALAVVAILSTTLWLTGCGGNQGENKPGNKDAQKPGDKTDNPSGAEQKGLSNEVEFSADNIEKAGNTAAFSLLKEALEYTEQSKDFGYFSEEDMREATAELFGVEAEDLPQGQDYGSQMLTSNKEYIGEMAQLEDNLEEGTKEPYVSMALNEYQEELFPYKELIVEIAPAGSMAEKKEKEKIFLSFNTSRDFDLPENKDQTRKMINQLEQGETSNVRPLMIETIVNGTESEFGWYTGGGEPVDDPQKTAEGLNNLWNNKLPKILEERPRRLSLVKKLPENPTEPTEENSGAGEDQYSSEQAPYDELEEATFTAEELDASPEAKEKAIYQQAIEVAKTVLTKLENSEKFYHSNEEAWGAYDSVVWSVKNYDNVEDKQDTLISVTRAVLDDPDSTEVLSLALSYPEEEEAFLVQFVVEDYDNDIPEITDQSEINKFKEFIKSKEIEESGVLKAGDIMWNSTKTGEEIRIIPSVDDFDGETTLNILSDIKDKASQL